jgi:hypothetical protein
MRFFRSLVIPLLVVSAASGSTLRRRDKTNAEVGSFESTNSIDYAQGVESIENVDMLEVVAEPVC